MEGRPNPSPSSSKEPVVVLDVKPLRSLAPMALSALGLNKYSPPFTDSAPSFGSFSVPPPPNFIQFTHTFVSPQATNQRPVYATPLNARTAAPGPNTPNITSSILASANGESPQLGRKTKKPNSQLSTELVSSSGPKRKMKPIKPVRTIHDHEALHLPPCHDARESVEVILMTFDGLRRRVQQLDEVKEGMKNAALKVGPIMTSNELRVNTGKTIGPVLGIEVGDIFYFRFEMCLIGLHSQIMAGIDTMTARFESEDDTVATCIVSSGVYDNEDGDLNSLIYVGQGGASKSDKKKMDDQKLERGNLALERSLHRGSEIRVVRSAKDFSCTNGKIYFYDGVYKVHESWVEKGKSGFNVFKFKLLREPGQPDGMAVWKMTQKWIENPSSRNGVILADISFGNESIPVCLVNDVDDEKGPAHFTYVTKVKYLSAISSTKPIQCCTCQGVCLPGDAKCSCAQQNDGDLPYSSNGIFVSRKPMIYECSSSCPCNVNCRNRVTQKGIKLIFEVFKTRDRGWGLRSWQPIRAGTFICEYVGEVNDKKAANKDAEEDEYIFKGLPDKTLKWNYIPELLGEPSAADLSEAPKPLPCTISAKNMGNIARFMNHSCSPNVFWQPVQYDHSDDRYPHIMFFAIKHIPPMTELTYDYGQLGDDNMGKEEGGSWKTKKCLCGSSKCRGFFC